ncbi:sigma-70 family RNA polymerase sigma factor [Gilvibacter sp.]|uniref:RNA polymerase sigma factor n=1 Tax=Gilvibacter sp. TaxID=2729997 RepID=UPI0025BF91C9|nr:sigma-70 family RNA polymerase sigma factor [Gilvibacter sp.]NQX78429.1 sigma-70 family RNA polymerase sigma factor [Gilvibacter sp.]
MADTLNQLITACQQGDERAFQQLHAQYAPAMLGVIEGVVGKPEVAQELCQDVFLKVWTRLDSFDPEKGRFFTWLLNIARNTAIDHLRSRSAKEQKQNLNPTNFVDIFGGSNAFEGQTDAIGLAAIVETLEMRCKQLIDRLFFKGFTQQQTSEDLEIPLGTVKTQIRKCINGLRAKLGIDS